MKYLIKPAIFLSVLLIYSACSSEEDPISNCEALKEALRNFNIEKTNAMVVELTGELIPAITNDDQIGHRENINTLVNKLEQSCPDLKLEILCYECELSEPDRSLIQVSLRDVDDIQFIAYMYALISPLEPISIVQIYNAIPEELEKT